MQQRIVPNLWFDTEAEAAASFYSSVFKNSRIIATARYPDGAPRAAGSVMTIELELDGERLILLNGGPQFEFNEAVTLVVKCRDQAEIDYYWERLSDGGQEGPCGWLKDRFGMGWQVVPADLDEIFARADADGAERAMREMLGMRKLDIEALRRAAGVSRPPVQVA